MNSAVWVVHPPSAEADRLAQALDIPPAIARVLVNRRIATEEAAREFLFGDLQKLHDPYLMRGMDRAVARIGEAVDRGEKILIFGDYDVDGVLSTVMLKKALTTLGADVDYFIPERLTDGYGIKDEHVRIPVERGARLVISVDCGIKSDGFVARAREQGIDVIITDHHRPGETLPDAVAVLDPILPDSGYPDPGLAGVGVAFKLIQALLAKAGRQAGLPHYMKLVSIGTVADVAELKGENRLFVKQGLKGLRDVSNTGLRLLIEASGLGRRAISEGDLGFRIGPRINAAGRMGMTDLAVKLFFSEDPAEALALVQKLDELNSRRQKTEEKIFVEAAGRIEERGLDRKYKCLVLGDPDWHRGVIGIVASKLKDRFHRPVILFHYENGKAHGSGRSISEVPLIDLLEKCRSHFSSYGGHRLAVGCTLPTADMAAFKAALNPLADAAIPEDSLKKKLKIDAPLDFSAVDERFMAAYALLVPFGVGNPRPLFMADDVEVAGDPQVLKGKHLKFLGRQNGRVLEVLGWDKAEYRHVLKRGDRVSLAFTLMTSEYLGVPKTNLSIEDLKV
ncbi:MAG TPA: single-stranded-DNA-specific exonuclease RecJ [Candidatus Aminicenantes bacterium]|nr:single-stranded-DNA-specific exonuclease RecJ [Candidatus Aminicenantes bacterium]HRY64338.1 single-stranded-DNA-specific exonuclease RecJ [Candidatus Aminicenantes bacterium]HRZ71251.1 single-stranded-DNA-specific exonuclease RecJ [Candidatus Aminicenantes bacterium]